MLPPRALLPRALLPRALVLPLALLVLLVVRLGLGAFAPLAPGPGDPARLLRGSAGPVPTVVQGTLLADPSPNSAGPGCRVLLQLPEGRTELRLNRCQPLQEGWQVRAKGMLRQPRSAPHPLLAGPAERLARQGAFSQLEVEQLAVIGRPATPIADLRRRIAQALLDQAGASRGGVLAALVLGSAVVPLPLEVRDAFRAAGLSHALAASGFHLSVLLGAVMPLGRQLAKPLRMGLALGAMGLFVLMAGPQPSVLRAVVMGALALVVLESGWRAKPLGILLASVVGLLLWSPSWLLDVGFQLSAVATAALMVSARPLEEVLRGRLPKAIPGWFAAALAVPVAASLWTLPLQLLHFGVVPIYAVPANLVVAPLLTPITLGAMGLAGVAVLVPPLLPVVGAPVAWLCGLLLAVVRWFAALPMAQWQVGKPPLGLVLLFTAALVALLLPALAGGWRRLGWALLALVLVGYGAWLRADRLLLVHQGRLDLLVARHDGRAALVSLQGDGFSCQTAQTLAKGLGVQRLDWSLVLDPVAPPNPNCWQQQSALVLASGDGTQPLVPGERLASPGLVASALVSESRAVQWQVGRSSWLLLPDRQALWSWRDQPLRRRPDGVWLGFRLRSAEREWLHRQGIGRVWLSGEAPAHWPRPWAASGASGSLDASLG